MVVTDRRIVLAVVSLVFVTFALAASPALGQCPGSANSVTGNQFPIYTNSVTGDVWAGDQWVYTLSLYGFTRTNIANPDFPGVAQLAQVGYDRGNGDRNGGLGVVVVDCDCHNGGTVMAAAENAAGDSRLISDWQPYFENQAASTAIEAGRGIAGNFQFAQQVNAGPTSILGAQIAVVALPNGKFFGYIPTAGSVQIVDLTNTTGQTGQTCDSGNVNCHTNTAAALQVIGTVPWATAGVWVGQATLSGQTTYFLVGAAASTLNVAIIDQNTGIPTFYGSSTFAGSPSQLVFATVKGGAYIFSAEGPSGMQIYEIRTGNSVVLVNQPPIFAGTNIKHVVVKGSPGMQAPLLFTTRGGFDSFIDIWDTNWLTPGSSAAGAPRLGYTMAHAGNFVNGAIVTSGSFGAKVVQQGSIVYAYVFEVVGTQPQYSIASTRKDVSCIAADPTAPPVASFLMTNITASAQGRVGTNYYGDRWTIQDTTSTGVPLTGLEWDLIALGPPFAPDAAWSFPGPGTVPPTVSQLYSIIWPCDPAVGGAPASGASCFTSIGSPAGASASYNVQSRATNVNPPPNISAAVSKTVQKPSVFVNGQPGGPVNVLSGAGVLNALGSPSATQGNYPEATFNWTCAPGCGTLPNATSVNVPTTATSYSLSVTYRDGYTAPTVSGSIVQRDLIPAFSLAPSQVVVNNPLTLTNLMQAGSITGLFVTYNITGTASSSGTLNASFNAVNGTDQIIPTIAGGYAITLTYHYNGAVDGNGASQTTAPQNFTVVTWSPSPLLYVYADAAALTSPICPSQFGCNLVVNTTYYLKDAESVPGGVTHPGADFYFNSGGGFQLLGSSPAGTPQTTVQFRPTAVCLSGCALRVSVQGVTNDVTNLSIASATQPLGVSVSGPTSGSAGAALQFTANATGGVPPYSYFWDCNVQFQPVFVAGNVVQSCTYPSAGTVNVAARVLDSGGNGAVSGLFQVIIGGGGGGQLSLSVSGPSSAVLNTPLTFTANASGGSGGYTFSWRAGESPFEIPTSTGSSNTFTHTYPAAATYIMICTVTSGASTAQATKVITITPPLGPPAPSPAYTITGATLNPLNGTFDADAGSTVTFSALEVPANVAANGYTWDFADGSPRHGQQIQAAFSGTGSKVVGLTVTGDGVNRAGTSSAVINFNVHQPAFQALFVAASEHQLDIQTDNTKFWATDVSIANPGTVPITISPAFLGFLATTTHDPAWSYDLSTVTFDPAKKVTIPPKGSWSQVDVVKYLAGDVANKGTLVFRYEGGDATPVVTSRVYFAPVSDPLGPSAGSAFPAIKATKDGQVLPAGTQLPVQLNLPGLRGDASYDFRMTLFNSVGLAGMFRLSAVDQDGNPVTLKDPRAGGAPASFLDFAIGPYQGVDWSSDDFGLNDPTKRYVLQARRAPGFTTGRLLPLVSQRDRFTRDEVVITPDGPPELREPCVGGQSCVNYILPGGSRYLSPDGGRWKTSISVYNPSTQVRGLGFSYSYSATSLQPPELAATAFVIIGPGKLLFWDDIVAQVFATPENHLADLQNGTFGVLRIQHYVDPETTSSPLIVSGRNYDDQPTGTVGAQLSVYTRPISIGPGDTPLLITGLQQDDASNPKPRFTSTVNIFAYDDGLTLVRLTALKSDGTVLGTHGIALNNPGASGHFQPRFLGASDATGNLNGVQNAPISIKIEVVQGGRVGAYGLISDVTTRDPTYVQASPQN